MERPDPDVQRFNKKWERQDRGYGDDCHVWTGAQRGGYGTFGIRSESGRWKTVSAHRWIYKKRFYKLPDDMDLDHLCRVTNCVKPSHLEVVTRQENIRRSLALRTHCKNGHPYVGELRRCRTCYNEYQREYQRARQEAADRETLSACP